MEQSSLVDSGGMAAVLSSAQLVSLPHAPFVVADSDDEMSLVALAKRVAVPSSLAPSSGVPLSSAAPRCDSMEASAALAAPAVFHLQTATWKQLSDECKRRGIAPVGQKSELLSRLTVVLSEQSWGTLHKYT